MQEIDYLRKRLSITERLAFNKQRLIDALLDISRSINSNMPITALVRVYQHILHAQLGIEHLVFFILDDRDNWQCIENSSQNPVFSSFDVTGWLGNRNGIQRIPENTDPRLSGYHYFIPVFHKTTLTGYVFLSSLANGQDDQADEQLTFIQTITNIVVVANENKKLFRKQINQIVLQRELAMAADIQNMLVPSHLPDIPGIMADKLYKPHKTIGGDYFDMIRLSEEEFFFCVADISGKGIPAALIMANVQAYVRVLVSLQYSMSEFTRLLNQYILQATQRERYITLFAARYHLPTRRLTYVNAGHVPPLLYDKESIRELKSGCTILGMFDNLHSFQTGELTIQPNSWLICFTDGITEVFNNQNKMYDSRGVIQLLKGNNYQHPAAFNELLLEDLIRFNQSLAFEDDLTLLTLFFK